MQELAAERAAARMVARESVSPHTLKGMRSSLTPETREHHQAWDML